MDRTLVISDIHGCYREFNELLDLVHYHPQRDQLILLGDYVSKGPQSKKVVQQVMDMVNKDAVIALQGNHDERFADVVFGRTAQAEKKFIEHGGIHTAESYLGVSKIDDNAWIESFRESVKVNDMDHASFLDQLPLFYEDHSHIYVHAGLNPAYPNWKEQPKKDLLYIKNDFIQYPTAVNKTVIFGHTKTIHIHGNPEVWFGDGKIGIDGGCADGHQLNCLSISANQSYKTYSVRFQGGHNDDTNQASKRT